VCCPHAIDDVAFLYVHALTDRRILTWTVNGRRIQSVPVGSIFAVGERRAEAPHVSEEELRFQHRVVAGIASRVPAILPARFGSLIEDKTLEAIVRQSASVIDEAMTLVRGRAQMTLRTASKPGRRVDPTTVSARTRGAHVTGKQYLELLRQRNSPPLSSRLESAIARTSGCVVAERRQTTPAGNVAVYHLLNRADVEEYRRALGAVDGLALSGPWPPFAFVPELWS